MSGVATASVTPNDFQTPSISLVKTASGGILDKVGVQITYNYAITNTGNVTLYSPYTVTDDKIRGSNRVTCPTTPLTLAPGATVDCAARYAITQGDLEVGSVTNNATAQVERAPGGETVSASASLTVNVRQDPGLALAMSTTATSYSAGSTITYTYAITNRGNVTLTGLFSVTDDNINSGHPFACGAAGATIVPGGPAITCTADYVASQDDVDAGSVTDSAVATTSYARTPVTSNRASVTVLGPPATPALFLVISTTATSFSMGDWIDYSYTLTNTGNVTISGPFTVFETKGFDSDIAFLCGALDATIAPGAAVTCTLGYRVRPNDAYDGWLTNTAVGIHRFGTGLAVTSNEVSLTIYSAEIATELSATTGLVGDTIFDSATLSDAGTLTTGTMTYTYFDNARCEGAGHSAGVANVVGGVVSGPSSSIQFNTAGTYYWQAVYRGGGNDIIATSKCGDEVLTIGTRIATTLSATTGTVGASVHDRATISGADAPTGAVTYTVYDNAQCTGNGQNAGGGKIEPSGKVPDSASIQFNASGTYYWQAVYSGDNHNGSAASTCTDGQLTISATAAPAPTPTPTAAPSQAVRGVTATPANHIPPPPTTTAGSPAGDAMPPFALLIWLACGGLGLLVVQSRRKSIRR